ncbi:putative fungal fucose-specific lectin protein [Rosellinia necatrix]|uniref:Putative fungal fucose-specific lectin protein n=1 Tax=Rosellinia necatrix TaxID=77044 RepID=A0A1S7ULC9_ROSNE|nr:putative fungal fucose-specific lectin protein [Rosellinia necatrix]
MSVPFGREQFSTLEVATDADVLRQGKYPEVVPPSEPEVYGYYVPVKDVANAPNAQLPPHGAAGITGAAVASQIPAPAHSYSTYPEVADGNANPQPDGPKGAKICGIPRKYFWIAIGAAVLIIVAVVVGAVVGSRNSSSAETAADNNGDGSGSGSGSGNQSGNGGTSNSTEPTTTTTLALFAETRLASANFTDAQGNDNFLVTYQMNDASICMSAFNSSTNKWVVSTIVNGTEGIKLGTSLAFSTFWQGSNSPDVNLYYQSNGSSATIKALVYTSSNAISTTAVTPSGNWDSVNAVSGFNSLPGSALVSYGKQCEFCNQFGYLFWQGDQGLFMTENSGDGIKNADLIEVNMDPSTNTSVALTYSGTLTGDSAAITRRSLNLFYRSKTSGLTQLRIGNGMFLPQYVGRDIGPRTNFAAFSTGFNESDADNPAPLGFQVLSIDPDADADGVQLTYLKDAAWTAVSAEVEALADCKARATMAVHTGRRLYCLVGSGDGDDDGDGAGVEIIEWAWQGDPSDTSSYLDWGKVGAVDVVAAE